MVTTDISVPLLEKRIMPLMISTNKETPPKIMKIKNNELASQLGKKYLHLWQFL